MSSQSNPFMVKSFSRSIQLIQVLEGPPAKMICRFFITAPSPETGKHLVFKDESGQVLAVEPVLLDAFYEKRGWRTYGFSVVSVRLPRMKSFSVAFKGKDALRVSSEMLSQKIHEQAAERQALKRYLDETRARLGTASEMPPVHPIGQMGGLFEDSALVAIAGKAASLGNLVESFQMCEGFADMTIYYVDSEAQPVGALDADIRCVSVDRKATFAERVNKGVHAANGEVIFLASTDISFTAEDDLRLLRQGALGEEEGAVFPQGFFADGILHHGGLRIHDDGAIGYWDHDLAAIMGSGFHEPVHLGPSVSAADPQCLVFRKSVFEEVGGFDEQFANPIVTCVDFCFKLREAGYRISGLPEVSIKTYTPFIVHHLGRGFTKGDDIERLWAKWSDEYRRDALYDPDIDMRASASSM